MGARSAIALAAALLLTGAAFASPSLYVPGAAIALLVAGATAWATLAARGASVERVPGPATVVEGEPYPVRIRIGAGSIAPRGELVDPLLPGPLPVRMLGGSGLRVGIARGRASAREEVRFERWGRRRLEPARLVVRDPLGLCARSVESSGEDQVLILPRVEPVEVAGGAQGDGAAALASLGEGPGGGRVAALGTDLDGLRPYREGSPASRIHWPAVARHGELLERRLSAGGEGTSLVVLDAERPAGDAALERAVRAAASLCLHLAREGGCALLVSGSNRPLRVDRQLRGWAQAHARLALVEPGQPLRGLAQAATGGAIFWISAGDVARQAGGGRATCLVTPLPPPGSRPAFTVAGCAGLPVARSATRRRRARTAA